MITAEQLYSTTGWIENSTNASSNNRVKNLVQLSKVNENLDSSSPLTTTLIFESDGEDDEEEQKAKEMVSLIESSLPKQFLPIQTNFIPEPQVFAKDKVSTTKLTQPTLVSIVEPEKEIKVSTSTTQEEEEVDEVPKSMAEIFKLSNQIKRKRNKEKRKLREESKQYDDERYGKNYSQKLNY